MVLFRVLIRPIRRISLSMRRSVRQSQLLNIGRANATVVESETAPNGMLGRGHYEAVSKFIDDDNQTHLQFKWAFDIKKDWS